MRYENPYGSGYKVRKMDDESGYLIHIVKDQNFLAHHGVKGQKWGVITKEYEPVAVDRRKTRGFSPIAKVKARFAESRAREQAERQQERENWNAIFQRSEKRRKIIGTALGVGTLALSLYAGYKLRNVSLSSVLKGKKALASLLAKAPKTKLFDGKKAVKSLGAIKPSKSLFKEASDAGTNLYRAKELTKDMGFNRLKQILIKSKDTLTLQKARKKIGKAKNLIQKYRDRISK